MQIVVSYETNKFATQDGFNTFFDKLKSQFGKDYEIDNASVSPGKPIVIRWFFKEINRSIKVSVEDTTDSVELIVTDVKANYDAFARENDLKSNFGIGK